MPKSKETPPELKEMIRDVLNRERIAAGLTLDEELAHHLNVTPKTISFWRSGKGLGAFGRVFTPLLIKHRCPQINDTP